MATPAITATNVYMMYPQQEQPKRSRNLPPPELRCRAPTQDSRTKKQTGPQCTRYKVFDDEVPQANKSGDELVADELCAQHKKMMDRFKDQIASQLHHEQKSRVESKSQKTPEPSAGLIDDCFSLIHQQSAKARHTSFADPSTEFKLQELEASLARLLQIGDGVKTGSQPGIKSEQVERAVTDRADIDVEKGDNNDGGNEEAALWDKIFMA